MFIVLNLVLYIHLSKNIISIRWLEQIYGRELNQPIALHLYLWGEG